MGFSLERKSALLATDDRRAQWGEYVVYHPVRASLVSITSTSLQELDPSSGALLGETSFDLLWAALPAANNAASAQRVQLEHLTPAGSKYVVAIFQAKFVVTWDLDDMVLYAVTEVEKVQKSIYALAASACKDHFLFYLSEGSTSIRVTGVDSKDVPKKISRKVSNRNSQPTTLAYDSIKRWLCCGSSDGVLQFYHFSDENSLGGKDDSALVTLLFTSQTTQSPIVKTTFGHVGNNFYAAVAYLNRTIELWDLMPTNTRQKEPQRIATIQPAPPQVADFAKKAGDLTFAFHPELPVVAIHWQASSPPSSATVAAWHFKATGSPASAMTEWKTLLPPSQHEATSVVFWYQHAFLAYTSALTRTLFPLAVHCENAEVQAEPCWLACGAQLTLEQYAKYQDVPSSLLFVAKNVENSTATLAEFVLQRQSLVTGEVEKLDDLPMWKTYQGKQLVPWQVRWNDKQTALAVILKDPSKHARLAAATDENEAGFQYAVVELKTKPGAKSDSDSNGSTRVTSGSMLDALDLCFCNARSEEARASRPWLMLVLAATGKALSMQVQADQVESGRILLQQPVQRIFPTPLMLAPTSPLAATVGSKLLFMRASEGNGDAGQTLQLSDDDLTLTSTIMWKTRPRERVLNVTWNVSTPSTTSTTTSGDDVESQTLLAAAQTTERVVVLNRHLAPVAEYSWALELQHPQSLLWMAQSLLFVTQHQQLRYVTPLSRRAPRTGRLLCSLAQSGDRALAGATQHTQLLAAFGDRLVYAATDARSMDVKLFLRPLSICEPLVLGFASVPCDTLKAIVEREVLVFASSGGNEAANPLTNKLLEVLYHDFEWKDWTLRLVNAVVNQSGSTAASGGSTSTASSVYRRTAHLSTALLATLFLHSHQWKDVLRIFLAADPALEEYALVDDDAGTGGSAKLPSKTGALAHRFRELAGVLEDLGQLDLAFKCLDLVGDDVAMMDLLTKVGELAQPLVTSLSKDWAKSNAPLAALAQAQNQSASVQLESMVWRRHDLFSLLCTETIAHMDRRSRLLPTIRPFDKLTTKTQPPASNSADKASATRASILYWKRLAPEDAKDWTGLSLTPHFSADEPKPPNYQLLGSGGSGGGLLASLAGDGDELGGSSDVGTPRPSATSDASNDAKMTIGPFLEDEDAVVAYWRFEEGGQQGNEDAKGALESLDTSKRENNLQLMGFGSALKLVTSTAPVDKGEEGKMQEEFALQFPSSSTGNVGGDSEWGAKCPVRSGNTLDLGFVFDEDPYRRKLTIEVWIRNYVLAQQQKELEEQQSGEFGDDAFGSPRADKPAVVDAARRTLVMRRGNAANNTDVWWELAIDNGFLVLQFAGQTLQADEQITSAAAWQHVACTVDVTSSKHATLKLYLHGRCVGTREISSVEANAKLMASVPNGQDAPPSSMLVLGSQLQDYELTEVRVWASARTAEQLSDMKENYLGIAEAKRRLKIAIHKRNCQCEKCIGRRQKGGALAGGVAKPFSIAQPFPSTPPAARDRRRPQPAK